jgi:integrase
VRCALRLAPLVFVRPGELRKAEWADIDLDTAEWRYTVTRPGATSACPARSGTAGAAKSRKARAVYCQ